MTDLYEVELRHRARPNEPIKERHRKFMETMARYDEPWGYKGHDIPEAPDIPPGDLSSVVKLRALSGRGRRSYIYYPFRSEKYLRDRAQYDDYVIVLFKTKGVDAETLFNQVFSDYIKAFGCYKARISDPKVRMADWDHIVELCNKTGKDVDGRDGVYRFHPANFFDRELCRRAFNLTPEQIVKRLEGKVEKVSLFDDGVLIICSSKFPLRDEYERIDAEVKVLLK